MSAMPTAVFFGTPQFSVPALRALVEIARVPLVVSQPDRSVGRGRAVQPTPVKLAAQDLGIPVVQPEKLRGEEPLATLHRTGADFFFTAAYGKIVPESILAVPPKGCLNLHASLLPAYRGSAPIQWAVINGEKVTGFTLMLMDRRMDTGPMLETMRIEIHPGETAGELSARMSALAAQFIKAAVPRYLRGELAPVPQDDGRATYAPMLKKEDGVVDWRKPASAVVAHILGMNPWPMASATACGERLRVLLAELAAQVPASIASSPPGAVCCDGDSLVVRCGEGAVRITKIQAEGKKALETSCFLCGHAVPESFDTPPAPSGGPARPG